ncbi:MAG TPA: MASE1 domain-containing protein [Caulobacterales bacterium]|nr:MASE1 domain-containing protein [Caulobacterales bacterium]
MPPVAQGGAFSGTVIRAFTFAGLYLVAMVGAIEFARLGASVSPIWIASAILAWALIASPSRDWPLYLGATALAHLAGAVMVGDQMMVEIPYLAANLASPLIVAALMRWRDVDLDFEHRHAVLWFLLIGGVIAPGASMAIAFGGAAALTGAVDLHNAGVWFLSDGLSFIVFLPTIKVIADNDWRELIGERTRARAAVLFALLLAAHALAWSLPYDLRRFFSILIVPFLIYIAFELGLTGARTAIAVNAALIVAYALATKSPPGSGMPPQEYLFVAQVYLAAISACVLPLSAALAEKQRLYETASNALSEAQAAWGELIAAEAHYRLIADNSSEMLLRIGLDGQILFASPAWRALTAAPDDLVGQSLRDLAHADDRARHDGEVQALLTDGALDRPRKWQLRLRDVNDAWVLYDVRATLVAHAGDAPQEYVAVLRLAQG